MGSSDATWYYRIKSVRRRKRLGIADFDKKLLKLHKEEHSLWHQIRNLGYEPLIPPIQRGWKRIFVLRDDVKRSAQAEFFQNLLIKINTTDFSHKKDFTVKKKRKGKKVYVPTVQKLKEFCSLECPKIKFSEAEKAYFTLTLVWNRRKEYRVVYVFTEPWRYVLKVVPNMITEVIIKDSLLEQRANEISNYIGRNGLKPRLVRLLDGNYRGNRYLFYDKPKYENPLKDQPLHEIIAELDLSLRDQSAMPDLKIFQS